MKEFNAFLVTDSSASCDLTNFDFYHHVDDEVDKLDFQPHGYSFVNNMTYQR